MKVLQARWVLFFFKSSFPIENQELSCHCFGFILLPTVCSDFTFQIFLCLYVTRTTTIANFICMTVHVNVHRVLLKRNKNSATLFDTPFRVPLFSLSSYHMYRGDGCQSLHVYPNLPPLLQVDFILFPASLTYFCTFGTWCETKMAAIYSNLDDLLQK